MSIDAEDSYSFDIILEKYSLRDFFVKGCAFFKNIPFVLSLIFSMGIKCKIRVNRSKRKNVIKFNFFYSADRIGKYAQK